MLSLSLALLGFVSTLTGVGFYLSKVKKNQTPKTPILLIIFIVIGLLLGHGSIIASESVLLTVFAVTFLLLSTFIAAFLLFLFMQKLPPLDDINIRVGDKILPFRAPSATGEQVVVRDLKNRMLLKFYRGAWCPYCVAELNMLNDMLSELNAHGVDVVAISNDTVEQANALLLRNGLNFMLLSDENLEVIRQYGIEHHKALGWTSESLKTVFGITFSMKPFQYRSIAISTSILVDEYGKVVWIEQSQDYRLRASYERLMAVVKQNFDQLPNK